MTYWNNLSRLTNLLIISNFSLFFLTELVIRDRYYYTHLSLGFLFMVHIALILPLGVLGRLWFYGLCLVLEFISLYFSSALIGLWAIWMMNRRSSSHKNDLEGINTIFRNKLSKFKMVIAVLTQNLLHVILPTKKYKIHFAAVIGKINSDDAAFDELRFSLDRRWQK